MNSQSEDMNQKLIIVDTLINPFQDYIQDNPNIRKINFTHVTMIKCNLEDFPNWLQNVKFLNLSFNRIKTINNTVLPINLIFLSLSNNLIDDFDQISNLQTLQHLRCLSLKGNQISKVRNYRKQIFVIMTFLEVLDDIEINFDQVEIKGWKFWKTGSFKAYTHLDPQILQPNISLKKTKNKITQEKGLQISGQFSNEPSKINFGSVSKITKQILTDEPENEESLDLGELLNGTIYNFKGVPCKSYYNKTKKLKRK